MIGDLYGPVSCRCHDSYLPRKSGLHDRFTALLSNFPVDNLCYGDSAYPKLRFITRGAKRAKVPNPLNVVALENRRRMSKLENVLSGDLVKL